MADAAAIQEAWQRDWNNSHPVLFETRPGGSTIFESPNRPGLYDVGQPRRYAFHLTLEAARKLADDCDRDVVLACCEEKGNG